jgi:hypothetical protein
MKWVLIINLIAVSSCSGIQKSKDLESREPSSIESDSTCRTLLGPFFKSDVNDALMDKIGLIEKGIIHEGDLKILRGKFLINSLPQNNEELKQIEVSYLLIKKQYPHFDEEQILSHYQLLKNFCGM